MEYLKVLAPERSNQGVDILINGEKTGKDGEVLTLSKGIILSSVDWPNVVKKAGKSCSTENTLYG